MFRLDAVPWLNALGTIMIFLLLNLEITDFFAAPGERAHFFVGSAHFARDMSYTIGWALFALALLLASIWKKTKVGRYAAIALLGVTLLKLFLHDLAELFERGTYVGIPDALTFHPLEAPDRVAQEIVQAAAVVNA